MKSAREFGWLLFAIATLSLPLAAQTVDLKPDFCFGESSRLSSISSDVATSIQFVNASHDTAKVYWVDYSGNRVLYSTLSAGTGYVQDTYVTHPWVVTDANDKCFAVYFPVMQAGLARFGDTASTGTTTGTIPLERRIITTIAGGSQIFDGEGRLPVEIAGPGIIAVDSQDQLYFCINRNSVVVRVNSTDGTITRVAGNGLHGNSGDGGLATEASVSDFESIAIDPSGNLYIGVAGSLRKVDKATGKISTILSGLQFDNEHGGIAIDPIGNAVYVSEGYANRIQRISPPTAGGRVELISGDGVAGFQGDGGPAGKARLNSPLGIALDNAGNLLIADNGNVRIRRILDVRNKGSLGIIESVAGGGTLNYPSKDGPVDPLSLTVYPSPLVIDPMGNLFVGTADGLIIRFDSSFKNFTRIAGARDGYLADGGPAAREPLTAPVTLALDSTGNLYLDGQYGHILRVGHASALGGAGPLTPVAGNGRNNNRPDAIAARNADLAAGAIAVDPFGDVFLTEFYAASWLAPDGILRRIAGTGLAQLENTSGSEVPALDFALGATYGIAVDTIGNVFIQSGWITNKMSLDGRMDSIFLNNPQPRITIGTDGYLYGGDWYYNTVFRLAPNSHNPEPVAGILMSKGLSPDGTIATQALLNSPRNVAMDARGLLYIQDSGNDRIRTVSSDGKIGTLAGASTGVGGLGLAVDLFGNVLAATQNQLKLVTNGTAQIVAGLGQGTDDGDGGQALNAKLSIRDMNTDALGNIYILDSADGFSAKVRKILATPPTFDALSLAGDRNFFLNGLSGGAPVFDNDTLVSASLPPTPLNPNNQAWYWRKVQAADGNAAVTGVSFTARVMDGADWLSVNQSDGRTPLRLGLKADPRRLPPGAYVGTILVSMPDANPSSRLVRVGIAVTPGQPPAFGLDQMSFEFPFSLSSTKARSASLTISNSGSGDLAFAVKSDVPWLIPDLIDGTARPGLPVKLTITAYPTVVAKVGSYVGHIILSSPQVAGQTIVPVVITITETGQVVWLTQRGMSFIGEVQGGVIPPQTFSVLNLGSGTMSWNARSTVPWIRFQPSGPNASVPAGTLVPSIDGSSDAGGSPQTVSVVVDPTSLTTAKTYYGQVIVTAPFSANRVRVITVALLLAPKNSHVAAVANPPSLTFQVKPFSSPGSQELYLYNVAGTARRYSLGISSLPATVEPTAGVLDPARPVRIVIQPKSAPPGDYAGTITLHDSDGGMQTIAIRIIVADGPISAQRNLLPRTSSGVCTPDAQSASNALSSGTPAGYSIALKFKVVDSCGQVLDTQNIAEVSVRFSSGEPELVLAAGADGWEGTWQTRPDLIPNKVTLTVVVKNKLSGVTGSRDFRPGLPPDGSSSVAIASVGNAVSGELTYVLGTGGVIAINGTNLASTAYAGMPTDQGAGDTFVIITGGGPGDGLLSVPLARAADNSLRAILPLTNGSSQPFPANTTHQIFVTNGASISTPVSVTVAAAQPAVLPLPVTSAPNQGEIFVTDFGTAVAAPVGSVIAVDPAGQLTNTARPAHPNDYIAIFCSGLGATSPLKEVNQAQSGNTPPVTLNIGGKVITSLTSATSGLVRNRAGEWVFGYTVTAQLPPDVPTGDQVPVTITIQDQSSRQVTMAIQ